MSSKPRRGTSPCRLPAQDHHTAVLVRRACLPRGADRLDLGDGAEHQHVACGFLFPLLQSSLGLRGTLLLTAGASVLGLALTLVLPESAGQSLDDIAAGTPRTAVQNLPAADLAPVA